MANNRNRRPKKPNLIDDIASGTGWGATIFFVILFVLYHYHIVH